MSQSLFNIEKGLQIDSSSAYLTGSGAPGTTNDTNNASVGSHYTDTVNGAIYAKVTAGSGVDKWKKQATEDFVNAAAGIDWKNSVKLATDAALPAYTASGGPGVDRILTADAVGILTVDGVAMVLNDDLLVKDEAGAPGHVDHGLYEMTVEGTAGVAFVLTRRTDADEDSEVTASLQVGVNEGTENEDTYWALVTNDPIVVDTTTLQFAKVTDEATLTELGFIRAFIGKVSGNDTPDYSSNNYVVDTESLETAIGGLDAQVKINADKILQARVETSSTNVTTAVTVDSVLVDDVTAVRWVVYCEGNLEADANKKQVVEIMATHDGHNTGAGDDATDSDYTVYAKLKMGVLTGLTFTVDVNGTGAGQTMRLRISSTTAINIHAVREIINF